MSVSAQARTTVVRLTRGERFHMHLDLRWRLFALGVFVALLVGWEVFARTQPDYYFASPSETLRAFPDLWDTSNPLTGHLWQRLFESTQALALGYGLAAVTGILIGYAMGWWRPVARLLNPYINAIHVLPIIALTPLMSIWLGLYLAPRVMIVYLFCVFEIIISAYGGIRSVNPRLIDVARTFGAGKHQLLRRVVIPSSVPFVFVGLRTGASRAIKGMITAEMLMASAGLGKLIHDGYQRGNQIDEVFATIIVVCLLGVVFAGAVQLLERWLLRWRPSLASAGGRASSRTI